MKLTLTVGTAIPTLDTDGVALAYGRNAGSEGFFKGKTDNLVLDYRATVSTGQTAALDGLKVWVFSRRHSAGGTWAPLGPAPAGGTNADRGKLNNGVALGEDGADQIEYTDLLSGLGAFERIYLQEINPTGTGYARTAYLVGA